MKIVNGIEMLEVNSNVMGNASTIYPTLIVDEDNVILVDTGFPGLLEQFKTAIETAGTAFENLNMIILTHHDIDHIGNVSSIVKALEGKVKVMAHEVEAPYVNGDKTPLKLAQLEDKLEVLPKEMKGIYEKLKAGFEMSKANIDETLADNEELPYHGGITVINTPGHTLGHICLYFKKDKILIAGDVLKVENGKLDIMSMQINYDQELTIQSLKKLTQYDIETVICYHGGIFKDKVNERIRELAEM